MTRQSLRFPAFRFPKVIGHRGCAQLAPENTLAGFSKAHAIGCRWVEFDLRLSLDGVPVVIHDDTLERTTDGTGPVGATRLAELRNRDAGSHFAAVYRDEKIPTLDETLALLRTLGLGCDLELKAEPGRARALAEAAARTIERLWPSTLPLMVTSFSMPALEAFAHAAPDVPRGYLARALPPDWRAAVVRLGAVAAILDQTHLGLDDVGAIKSAGVPLLAYTVNHPARAAELFAWGVDAVISDAPDGILELLK